MQKRLPQSVWVRRAPACNCSPNIGSMRVWKNGWLPWKSRWRSRPRPSSLLLEGQRGITVMRQHLLKRCAVLELRAQELRRPQQQAEQRHQQWVDNMVKLFAVFPEERHEEMFAWLKRDRWKGSVLAEVLNLISRGFWQPVPIPAAVADVFLTDLLARVQARCGSCATLLPLRGGIWTNTETGQWWQAPLQYFRTCPCG